MVTIIVLCFNKSLHDLIYISNLNQELTNHEISMSSINNFDKLRFEEDLINKVFSKINYKVLFKEYPGSRSSDLKNDYIKKVIEPHQNITYFNEWLNAENIYENSSIIMTTLPTSGLGGAIKSEKPLIFIDIKKIMPLRDELINDFKKEFFYYNYDSEIFDNLKKFLSNNIGFIKRKWIEKRMNNSNFKEEYINIKTKDEVLAKLKNEIIKFVQR